MQKLNKEQKAIIYTIITLSIISLILIIIFNLAIFENTSIPMISFEINEKEYYNSYIENLYDSAKDLDNVKISHKKYNSKNYISYVFKIRIKNKNTINNYLTLVIDKQNKKVINNSEIASIYGYELSEIETIIRTKLKKYYNEAIKEEYIDNGCNFYCYLYEYREIEDMSSIYSLSIEKNKLVVYFNLNKTGNVDDMDFFKNYKNPSRIELDMK